MENVAIHRRGGKKIRDGGGGVPRASLLDPPLPVYNFVLNEGINSATDMTEALSLPPFAFAKHTHTTIWLNTTLK